MHDHASARLKPCLEHIAKSIRRYGGQWGVVGKSGGQWGVARNSWELWGIVGSCGE